MPWCVVEQYAISVDNSHKSQSIPTFERCLQYRPTQINVKKLQFIHKLTANDASETAKVTKKVILPSLNVNVLLSNHLFVIFAVLDVSLAVNLCINCSFFSHLFSITLSDH